MCENMSDLLMMHELKCKFVMWQLLYCPLQVNASTYVVTLLILALKIIIIFAWKQACTGRGCIFYIFNI